MSDELKAFYRAYLAWLDDGAPEPGAFRRDTGLCGNLWAAIPERAARIQARDEMRDQFKATGLSRSLPFNTGYDTPDYGDESFVYRCHLNPKRIAWVREHAQ